MLVSLEEFGEGFGEFGEVDVPVAGGFYDGGVPADDAARFQEEGCFQEAAAVVALVSAGAFVAAVGTFAFHEAVRQEALVVFAVQHLRVLGEDVAVFVDFHEGLLDEFFVDGAFCAGVVVEGCAPLFE